MTENRPDSVTLKMPDVATYKEVADLVKMLVKQVKSFKEDLSAEHKESLKELVKSFNAISKEIDAKKKVLDTDSSVMSKDLNRKIEYAKSLLLNELKRVEDSIPSLPDLSYLERKMEAMMVQMREEMPHMPEELTPEQVRFKLETLEGDERLDKSAIKGLDELEKELTERITTVKSGGGVTNMRIQQAFKYILKTEAPVGAVNGSNTTYTLSQPIFAILSMSINGETIAQLPNYTISNKSFTFSTALPAAYSGKDFEVKYI